jgi:hypothetical protein
MAGCSQQWKDICRPQHEKHKQATQSLILKVSVRYCTLHQIILQGLDDNLKKHTIKVATLQSTNCVQSQSWRPDTTSRRLDHAAKTLFKYFTAWELRLNTTKLKSFYFPNVLPPPNHGPYSNPLHLCNLGLGSTLLGLVLHSRLLYTQHLHTVANKATGVHCNNFPRFIARPVQQVNPLQITHSVHSNALRSCLQFHSSNYLNSQLSNPSVTESWVIIPNFPLARLSINNEPIPVIIHRLTPWSNRSVIILVL